MSASRHECLLALSHARFLRARERIAIAEAMGSVAELSRLSLADLGRVLGRRVVTREWDPARLTELGERTARTLARGVIGCVYWGEPGFPSWLAYIYDPPAALFHRGPLPGDGRTLVAIVGTRLPTGAGREASFRLALELARAGIGVVSGLARGVDREAHEGCVRGGGISVAVLASGVDVVSPASSRSAARRLLEAGGALVSENPPGTPPRAWLFPERNRLISGLCRSVVVIQAPERSGALITADYALGEGRDLYVHAAGLAGNASAGTRKLAESGAPVVRSAAGILADWERCGRSQERAADGESMPVRYSRPPRGLEATASRLQEIAHGA